MAWKRSDELPGEIATLGPIEASYRWAVGVLLFRCFFAVGGCLVGIYVLSFVVQPPRGNVSPEPIAIVVAIIIGIILPMGAGIVGIRNNYRRWKYRVLVVRDGLFVVEADRFLFFRWTDIEAVWLNFTQYSVHGLPVGTAKLYTIRLYEGEQITIKGDDMPRSEDLGPILQQKTANHLLVQARNTIRVGGSVSFGTLVISQRGFETAEATLPWEEFQSAQISEGVLEVTKIGNGPKWLKIAAAQIPNLHVLLALIAQLSPSSSDVRSRL
jgi:hypothetical protein